MSFNHLDALPEELRQEGFAPRSHLTTPHGPTRVDLLQDGDMILTEDGFVPVLRVVRTPVRSDMMAFPVRLTDHDDCGIEVAPYQMVRVRDTRGAALFGRADFAVEARFLPGWRGIRTAPGSVSFYCSVHLAAPHVIWGTGALIPSAGARADDMDMLSDAEAREWRTMTGVPGMPAPAAPIAHPLPDRVQASV